MLTGRLCPSLAGDFYHLGYYFGSDTSNRGQETKDSNINS